MALDPNIPLNLNPKPHEDLNNDQGFVAKPYARKKVIRTPDGALKTIYVDVRTGREVGNPQGYNVIESDNVLTPQPSSSSTQDQNQGQQEKTVAKEIINQHGPGQVAREVTQDSKSKMTDQYGYTNKPGWMGFTGYIPGPVGLMGKALNLGVNTANTQAVNEQREALGFSPNPLGKNLVSGLIDQKGYIGEASTTRIDGTKSIAPVSFEAEDKYNRTAYTPEEARRHTLLAGTVEATPEEKTQAVQDFKQSYPEQSGFMTKLADSAKGLFSSLFGGTNKSSSSSGKPAGGGFGGSSTGGTTSGPTNAGGKPDTSGYSPGLF